MKAIEIKSKTDKKEHLKIDYQVGMSDRNVRVLILVEESSDSDEEKLWLDAISKNPAFDFLEEETEDIYSLKDREDIS